MTALLQAVFSVTFVMAVVRMTVPILLPAVGDVFCERTGVLNIALEGMMVLGAFFGFVGAVYGKSPVAGFFLTIVVGLIIGACFAFFTVTLGCNQVVTALGFNMLGLGLTATLNKYLFGITIDLTHAENMPLWLGQNIFFYLAFLSVPMAYVIFKYTKWGLKLRSIGEYPRAADTVGVKVYLNRYITCMISGVFACMGGASMTIGGLGYFQDNMVAGRGFIAFAAVIFGRYSPVGALLACLVFGFADALQLRMQSLGFSAPYHLFIMLPYVVTIVLLVLFGGKAFIPKAQGTPYVRDER